MLRLTAFWLLLSLIGHSVCVAQGEASIPAEFTQQFKRMVGSWVFSGNEGGRLFSGKEKIRLVNNGTSLLQEGYFDAENGTKEHYVILSGWDGDKKTVIVRGFTSAGVSFTGEWKKIGDDSLVGSANGSPARFKIGRETMVYEEDGGKWVSKFERLGDPK